MSMTSSRPREPGRAARRSTGHSRSVVDTAPAISLLDGPRDQSPLQVEQPPLRYFRTRNIIVIETDPTKRSEPLVKQVPLTGISVNLSTGESAQADSTPIHAR